MNQILLDFVKFFSKLVIFLLHFKLESIPVIQSNNFVNMDDFNQMKEELKAQIGHDIGICFQKLEQKIDDQQRKAKKEPKPPLTGKF